MSGQDKRDKILSDLRQLSLLEPGKTLSVSTMTVVDHGSWSSSIWRRYAREDRKQTLAHIRAIFSEALSLLELAPSTDLANSFEPALRGVSHLKETYRGDYYVIGEINRIIETTQARLSEVIRYIFRSSVNSEDNNKVASHNEPEGKQEEGESADDAIWAEIVNEIDSLASDVPVTLEQDQKICPNEDNEGESVSNTSYFEKVVSSPNRDSSPETINKSIDSSSSIGSATDCVCVPTSDIIYITRGDHIKDLVLAASDDTTKIVLEASNEIKKSVNERINNSDFSKSRQADSPGDIIDRKNMDTFDFTGEQLIDLSEVMIDPEDLTLGTDESEKVIKNISTPKDIANHVNVSTSPFNSSGVPDAVVINFRETAYVTVETDSELSKCGKSLCSCLTFSRHNDNNSSDELFFSKCPAFAPSTLSSIGNSAKVDRTSPILRLARAFKEWIDSVGSDSDDDLSDLSSGDESYGGVV